ncbi:winged helix-turn-helix domain-containing protein [Ancylobacter terrae]|uniref:winged helix-turn-helix domain-containing protein n=1 Tax=Ancylobacter sp. sgz301288 TaxID=3342077 RepID=UPI003858E651
MSETISLKLARRIALAAQGFAEPRPVGMIGRRHMRRVLDRIGLFQIDSVSVVARAHYLPLFSRLGGYPRELIDVSAWATPCSLFEYWAHEASLLPVETQPLWRWRMARAEQGIGIYGGLARFGRERRTYIDEVLAQVRARGPLAASDFDCARGEGGWWGWSEAKRALEWLFWAGLVTTATRRGFERLYDIPERVLPAAVLALPTPEPAEAQRQLLCIAARALGVATAGDLRDYFRLAPDDVKARLPELVEAGEIIPARVEGWSQPAYLHAGARRPRRVEARALLAPFDPLIWERARTERLFGFRYRIEIYTPAEKRAHGYYVLPFLLGDRLVTRVDLKSNRAGNVLQVQSSHAEEDAPPETGEALIAELRHLAAWLGLERVEVSEAGDFAAALRRACAAPAA